MTHPPLRPGSSPGGPARRIPPDLAPREADVAAWFSRLERPEAPAHLRRAILAEGPGRAGRPSRPRWIRAFPLGAWGVASAALLLAAVGIAATVELIDPAGARPAQGVSTSGVRVVEDVSMPLFHDLETFDDVGIPRGALIADWGR